MKTMYKVTESALQALIRSQLALMGFYVVRCNVGSVKREGGGWFSSGLPRGFSDLLALKNGHTYFIEVKVHPNKPSTEQVQFIEDMRAMGFRAGVAYSLEEAINIVQGEET